MTASVSVPQASPIRVMIVDDSAVVRGLLERALATAPGIEVAAMAGNGREAIERLRQAPADVILLDIEMPEMDGLTALPQLLAIRPGAHVIVVSTLTPQNAEMSIRALKAGVSDYIAKPSAHGSDKGSDSEVRQFYEDLVQKIRLLVSHRPPALGVTRPVAKTAYPSAAVKAVAIGCSTGGPQALFTVLAGLAPRFPQVPVFITQHMPAAFTPVMANHLAEVSGRPCAEGRDGEEVRPGALYIAPGNFHMVPEEKNGRAIIRVNQDPPVHYCRPAADPMFAALARIYGRGLLAIVLTGMGNDGVAGIREVAAAGGTVVAQDEASSVVWGMPRAVAESGLASAILPLDAVASYILRVCA